MEITSELFHKIVNNCLGTISALQCESQSVYEAHNVVMINNHFLNWSHQMLNTFQLSFLFYLHTMTAESNLPKSRTCCSISTIIYITDKLFI